MATCLDGGTRDSGRPAESSRNSRNGLVIIVWSLNLRVFISTTVVVCARLRSFSSSASKSSSSSAFSSYSATVVSFPSDFPRTPDLLPCS